jgi:hypothetical protein
MASRQRRLEMEKRFGNRDMAQRDVKFLPLGVGG